MVILKKSESDKNKSVQYENVSIFFMISDSKNKTKEKDRINEKSFYMSIDRKGKLKS